MRPLAELQRHFAEALLDPRRPEPSECIDPDGRPDALRFAVYRNNVASSLIEALEAAYPAVRRLVGKEFFRATARQYVLQDPPRSPIMLRYGGGFADFLERLASLSDHPYLADVARIERAWLEAYHAAEAEPLEPVALAGIATQPIAGLCLTLHPSVRLVRSAFPALTIWQANVTQQTPPRIDLDAGAEDVLIARPGAEVQVRLVPPQGALLLQSLARGSPLVEAASCAGVACASFDLTTHLAVLLESGLVIGSRLIGRSRAGDRRKNALCR